MRNDEETAQSERPDETEEPRSLRLPTIDERSLLEKLCNQVYLSAGFKAVKKNGGSPGVDGVTVDDFSSCLDEELARLKTELESWSYKPMPVRRVEIAKPDKGAGVRLLGVPCTRDRVVQTTLELFLGSILDITVRRRLWSRLVDQQKRGRHLFKKITNQGVSKGLASKTVYSNDGKWVLSRAFALHLAYQNRWFIDSLGSVSGQMKNSSIGFPLNQWIKVA